MLPTPTAWCWECWNRSSISSPAWGPSKAYHFCTVGRKHPWRWQIWVWIPWGCGCNSRQPPTGQALGPLSPLSFGVVAQSRSELPRLTGGHCLFLGWYLVAVLLRGRRNEECWCYRMVMLTAPHFLGVSPTPARVGLIARGKTAAAVPFTETPPCLVNSLVCWYEPTRLY